MRTLISEPGKYGKDCVHLLDVDSIVSRAH